MGLKVKSVDFSMECPSLDYAKRLVGEWVGMFNLDATVGSKMLIVYISTSTVNRVKVYHACAFWGDGSLVSRADRERMSEALIDYAPRCLPSICG